MKNSIVIIVLLCIPLISFAQSDEQLQEGISDVDVTQDVSEAEGEIMEESDEEFLVETEEIIEDDIAPVEIQEPVLEEEFQNKTVENIAKEQDIDVEAFAQKISIYVGAEVEPETTFQLLYDNYGLGSAVVKEMMNNITVSEQRGDDVVNAQNMNQAQNTTTYPFFLVLAIVVVLYSLSYILVITKKIQPSLHQKLWSVILAISFFATAILGIVWILKTNHNITFLSFDVVYWHIIVNTIMMTLALLHTLWRRKYRKSIIRGEQQNMTQATRKITKKVM